jgi:membrane-associated phospholipid phosphatase
MVVAASAVPAPTPADAGPNIYRLRHLWLVDAGLTGIGAATWFTTEALKQQLAPATCHWCDRKPDGTDTLNALDAWGQGIRLSPSGQATADTLSSVLAFGILPVGLITLDLLIARNDGALRGVPVDLLIITEASVAAALVDQLVKFSVARARPFLHALPPDQAAAVTDRDANLSFFSGHSTFAFALAVATGTVAHLRGYRWEWLVWAIGLPVAAVVPVLRMAADKHYLTDVLVGSAVGAAFGFGVPELFHARIDEPHVDAHVVASPGGLALSGTF